MKIQTYTPKQGAMGQGASAFSIGGEKRNPVLKSNAEAEHFEKVGDAAGIIADVGQRMTEARKSKEYSEAQVQTFQALSDLGAEVQSPEFRQKFKPHEYEREIETRLSDIQGNISETFSENQARDKWDLSFRESSTKMKTRVRGFVRGLEVEEGRVSTYKNLEGYKDLFLKQPATALNWQSEILAQVQGEIAGKVKAGLFTETEGYKLNEEFTRDLGSIVVGKHILMDPEGTVKRLNGNEAYGYIDEADRLKYIKQARAEVSRQAMVQQRAGNAERSTILSLAKDDLSSLRTTGKGIHNASREVERVIGKTAADQHGVEQRFALRQYQIGEQLKAATPQEAGKILESLVPEPGTQGFDRRQKLFESSVAMFEGIQRQLQTDPAGYVQQFRELRTPEAVLAEQKRLGVPSHMRAVLSRAQADNYVKDLMSQSADELSLSILGLSKQYGKHFPTVYRDLVRAKLPEEIQLLTVLDRPGQAETRVKMANAVKMGESEIKKVLGPDSTTIVRDINDAIKSEMTEFDETILNAGGSAARLSQLGRMKSAVRLASMAYVARGMDTDDAVKRVVDDTFNSRYTYNDSYRVPVEHSADQVSNHADSLKESIGDLDLVIPGTRFENIPMKTRRASYVRSIKNQGYWVTNEDETGLVLMDSLSLPVLMESGGRVEFSFEHATTGVTRFKITGGTK